jgi:hypothetical protein
METNMAEKLNITHHYDRTADVLYIDFGFDEPCFTEALDGSIMVDIGWFSKLPRGARIMSPKAHKIESIKMVIGQIGSLMEKQVQLIQTTEPVLKNDLAQELNRAFSCVD